MQHGECSERGEGEGEQEGRLWGAAGGRWHSNERKGSRVKGKRPLPQPLQLHCHQGMQAQDARGGGAGADRRSL